MSWNSAIRLNIILGILLLGSLGLLYSNQTPHMDQNRFNFDDREFEAKETPNRVKVIIQDEDRSMKVDLPKIREKLGIGSNIKLDLVFSGQVIIENQILDGDTIELSSGSNSIIRNNTIRNFKNTLDDNAGVQAYGIKVTSSANVLIVNNTITNISASAIVSRPPCTANTCESIAAGIWLSYLSDSIIANNTIENIVANSTNEAQNSAYGVYSYSVYNNSYVNNNISNVVADTANNLEIQPKAYGFYVMNVAAGTGSLNFTGNMVKDIFSKLHISAATNKGPVVASHGIYLYNSNDTKIFNNTFENINSYVTHTVYELSQALSYGVYLSSSNWLDRLNISNNKFTTINSTSIEIVGSDTTATPTAKSWGIYSADRTNSNPAIDAVFENNEFNGIYAKSNQIAAVHGILLTQFPMVEVINNTINNLVSLLYNSLDGLTYSSKKTTVDGIVSQAMNATIRNNKVSSLTSTGDSNSIGRQGAINGIWITGPNSTVTNNIIKGLIYELPIMADHVIFGYGIRIEGGDGLVQDNEITEFAVKYIDGGLLLMTGIQVGIPDQSVKTGSNNTKILSNIVGTGISHKFWGIKVEYSTDTELFDNVIFGTVTLPVYDYQNYLLPTINFEYYFTDSGDSIIRSGIGLMNKIAYFSFLHYSVENMTLTKDSIQVINYNSLGFDSPLQIETAGLPVGTVIYGVSTLSGTLLSTITLTISSDSSAPYVSQLPDLSFEEGILSKSIAWLAKDGSPTTFRILQDGVQIATGTWSSDVPVIHDITSLTAGNYNLSIEFSDTYGRQTSSGLTVTMLSDTSPPVLLASSFDTLSAALGGSLSIFFNASDNHPSTYIIYENGTQIISAGWLNDVSITQLVNTSISALFNYTVVIFDGNGESVSKTIMIDVRPDTTTPGITHGGSINFISGELDKTITFNINEQNGGTYILYQNDVQVDTGPLTNVDTIVVWDVSSLTVGTFNFTLTATDSFGNFIWTYLIVTVFADTGPPTIVWNPSLVFNVGETNQFVRFTGWDNNPDNYILYMDGVVVDSGNWVSAVEISYSLDGLAEGSYTFTMEFYDTAGNIASQDTIVTVTPVNTGPAATSSTDTDTFSDTFTGDEGDDSAGFLPSPPVNILAIFMMYFIVNIHRRKKKNS